MWLATLEKGCERFVPRLETLYRELSFRSVNSKKCCKIFLESTVKAKKIGSIKVSLIALKGIGKKTSALSCLKPPVL